MTEVFASYGFLEESAPEVHTALLDLEVFIGNVDGVETDEGTFDAEEAVTAFNVLVKALQKAHERSPTWATFP